MQRMRTVDNLILMSKLAGDAKRRIAIGEMLDTSNGAQIAGDISVVVSLLSPR
jgi:hypothetical protein